MNIILKNGARMPKYKTQGSSGMDLESIEDVELQPFIPTLISTGLYVKLERGYEAQVRPRSGLALKHTVTVLNAPATIDSDYTGELKVILINLNPAKTYQVKKKERIAQLVIAPVTQIDMGNIENRKRGESGFGSTGK